MPSPSGFAALRPRGDAVVAPPNDPQRLLLDQMQGMMEEGTSDPRLWDLLLNRQNPQLKDPLTAEPPPGMRI